VATNTYINDSVSYLHI